MLIVTIAYAATLIYAAFAMLFTPCLFFLPLPLRSLPLADYAFAAAGFIIIFAMLIIEAADFAFALMPPCH